MEVANLLIYIILIIVLVSLIGVSGWLLYDYNNLKTQLSSDFKTISNRFSTHKTKDNALESGLNTNTSNITSTKTELTDSIEAVKKDFTVSVDAVNVKTDKHDKNFATFNDNLNKYFTFGTEETGINAADNKIYSYVTDDNSLIDNDKKLKLIHDTIIASELTIDGGAKLKTDSDKKLKVCDISGDSCFDIYKNANDLIIKAPDNNGKIIIGGGTPDNSLVIESGNLKFNGNLVHHTGTPHTHPLPRPLAHTHASDGSATNADVDAETSGETASATASASVADAAAAAASALLAGV
jgi:hypothetical protein